MIATNFSNAFEICHTLTKMPCHRLETSASAGLSNLSEREQITLCDFNKTAG